MSKYDLRVKWRSKPQPSRVILTGDSFYKTLELEEAAKQLPSLEIVHVEDGDYPAQDLFATQRIIVFHDVDLMDKKVGDRWVRGINDLDTTDILVFVTSDKNKSPAYFKLLKYDVKVDYEEIKAWEIPGWLVWDSARYDMVLQEKYAELLVLNLGEDRILLDRELLKMKIYKESQKSGAVITVDEIQNVFVAHQVMKPFVMLEAWGKKNHGLCLRLAERIYNSMGRSDEVVFGWTALFLKHIESLIRARSMLDFGLSESSVTSEMGWNRGQSNKMLEQVQVQNTRHLIHAYRELADLQKTIIYETDRFQKFTLWIMYSERMDA